MFLAAYAMPISHHKPFTDLLESLTIEGRLEAEYMPYGEPEPKMMLYRVQCASTMVLALSGYCYAAMGRN